MQTPYWGKVNQSGWSVGSVQFQDGLGLRWKEYGLVCGGGGAMLCCLCEVPEGGCCQINTLHCTFEVLQVVPDECVTGNSVLLYLDGWLDRI